MADLGIGQQGKLKSTPKIVRINGDDDKKAIYRNMGNNHSYPFVWSSTATIDLLATSKVLASGIKWHGYDLASYATIIATPDWNTTCFVTRDTVTNVVTLNVGTAATVSGTGHVGLMFMLGNDLEVEGLYCRGNIGANQCFP
jgi:hypothetical protein